MPLPGCEPQACDFSISSSVGGCITGLFEDKTPAPRKSFEPRKEILWAFTAPVVPARLCWAPAASLAGTHLQAACLPLSPFKSLLTPCRSSQKAAMNTPFKTMAGPQNRGSAPSACVLLGTNCFRIYWFLGYYLSYFPLLAKYELHCPRTVKWQALRVAGKTEHGQECGTHLSRSVHRRSAMGNPFPCDMPQQSHLGQQ